MSACCTQINTVTLDLKNLSSLLFPRQYSTIDGTYELHLFCDASQYGMGRCIYLRTTQGTINKSSSVASKARIFPQSKILKFSIARKKLVALCLGTDLLSQVKKHLSITIDKTYVWTDSMTVIKWCQCKIKQFVRNRVDKILEGSSRLCPNYIDTKNNPADMASRGINLKQEIEIVGQRPSLSLSAKEKLESGRKPLRTRLQIGGSNSNKICLLKNLTLFIKKS